MGGQDRDLGPAAVAPRCPTRTIGTRASVTRGCPAAGTRPTEPVAATPPHDNQSALGTKASVSGRATVLRNPVNGLKIVLLDEVPHRVWGDTTDPRCFGAQPGSTHEAGA
jgi:hypothetical protein